MTDAAHNLQNCGAGHWSRCKIKRLEASHRTKVRSLTMTDASKSDARTSARARGNDEAPIPDLRQQAGNLLRSGHYTCRSSSVARRLIVIPTLPYGGSADQLHGNAKTMTHRKNGGVRSRRRCDLHALHHRCITHTSGSRPLEILPALVPLDEPRILARSILPSRFARPDRRHYLKAAAKAWTSTQRGLQC